MDANHTNSGIDSDPFKLVVCATIHGAMAFGVNACAIEGGEWADFALINLRASRLADATDKHVAAIFGGCGEGLVLDTYVAGCWTTGIKCTCLSH